MLILHFLTVYLLQAAVKVQKLDFKAKESTEFITLRPLAASSLCLSTTAQGLWVINSVGPCVLKSNYYLAPTNKGDTALAVYFIRIGVLVILYHQQVGRVRF